MDLREKVAALIDAEFEKFLKAIDASQDLTLMVLRVHLSVENMLERFIAASLPRGDRLIDKSTLGFYQKLQLVDAFDILSDSIITSLTKLNTLRNRCAHDLEKSVTEADIDSVGKPLQKRYVKLQRDAGKDVGKLAAITFLTIFGEIAPHLVATEHSELPAEMVAANRKPISLVP